MLAWSQDLTSVFHIITHRILCLFLPLPLVRHWAQEGGGGLYVFVSHTLSMALAPSFIIHGSCCTGITSPPATDRHYWGLHPGLQAGSGSGPLAFMSIYQCARKRTSSQWIALFSFLPVSFQPHRPADIYWRNRKQEGGSESTAISKI